MRRVHLLILVMPMLLTVAGAECGTTFQGVPQQVACLSIDDVINIPSGDATGAIEWGTYRAVSNTRTSCAQCELNTVPESKCTDSTVDPTARATFTQNEGRLTVEGTDGTSLAGGINNDGTFTLGTIATPTADDGTSGGQAFGLLEGQFVEDRIIGTLTMRMTVNESDGRTIDLTSISSVTYERVE